MTGHLTDGIYLRVAVIDPAQMEKYVVSGDIDLEAINAGREVLVNAPTCYAFLTPDDAVNTYRGRDEDWYERRSSDPDYTMLSIIENDAYAPGQELTLHYVWSDLVTPWNVSVEEHLTYYEQMEHRQVNVTVGAVLDGGYSLGDSVTMLTTEQGLANMGLPLARVSNIDIYTYDLTLEEEAALEKRITAIAMRGTDYEVTNYLEGRRNGQQENLMVLLLMLGVSLILLTVCIAQITGSVSRRIRAEVRMIGTIRAVGADARVVFRIYGGQVIMSTLIGTMVGMELYWFVFRRLPYMSMRYGAINWFTLGAQLLFAAATLLASLAILRLRIRDVTRHSIVENIREL